MEGPMQTLQRMGEKDHDGRRDAIRHSASLLRREGFTVSGVRSRSPDDAGRPRLVAAHGPRVVQVFVLVDDEVDSQATRRGLAAATRRGETRVFVRWPLRWRMLSNVSRWDLRGVAVSTW